MPVVVIQSSYDPWDDSTMHTAVRRVSAVFGSFESEELAEAWVKVAPTYDGRNKFEYEVKKITAPTVTITG